MAMFKGPPPAAAQVALTFFIFQLNALQYGRNVLEDKFKKERGKESTRYKGGAGPPNRSTV